MQWAKKGGLTRTQDQRSSTEHRSKPAAQATRHLKCSPQTSTKSTQEVNRKAVKIMVNETQVRLTVIAKIRYPILQVFDTDCKSNLQLGRGSVLEGSVKEAKPGWGRQPPPYTSYVLAQRGCQPTSTLVGKGVIESKKKTNSDEKPK